MGISVFNPEVLTYVKSNEYLDFPDLIEKLISNGELVTGFVHDGYCLDIGRSEDYERANREIDEMYDRLLKQSAMRIEPRIQ